MSTENNEQRRDGQAIELLSQALGLAPKEAKNGVAWLTRKWIQAVFYVIVLPIALISLVAVSKMYWHLTGIVRWAPYFIPLITLLILGAPVISGSISIISGILSTPKDGAGHLRTGLFEYGAFLRVVILWAIITPIGILLVPIQDCPTAYWMFVPFSLGHELAYHSDWHNAPPDREFQGVIMRLMRWGMIVCIILPFIFAAIHMASERGYIIPKEDKAAIEVRKARNESEEIVMQRRTACVATITQKVKNGEPLSTTDEQAMTDCNAKYTYDTTTGMTISPSTMWSYFAAMSGGLFALHIIGAIIIAGGLGFTGYKLVKTKDGKSSTVSSSISWGTIIFFSLLALASYSYFYGAPTWLKGIEGSIPTFPVATTEKISVSPLPSHFMTADEAKNWQAVVIESSTPTMMGQEFDLQVGKTFLQRIIHPEENREIPIGSDALIVTARDAGTKFILENSTCAPPQIYSDGNLYTSCAGVWHNGKVAPGTYELLLSSQSRILVLKSGEEKVVMKLQKVS